MEAVAKQFANFGDYRREKEHSNSDDRYEIVDGVSVWMGPAPGETHQIVVGEFFALIRNHLVGKTCRAFAAPYDVILVEEGEDEDEAQTVLQPDITVICDQSKRRQYGCLGAPDLVVEVLSPYSALRDIRTKRIIYERHGVSEYWIVNPQHRLVNILRLEQGRYAETVFSPEDGILTSSVLPELQIDLEAVFAQIEER